MSDDLVLTMEAAPLVLELGDDEMTLQLGAAINPVVTSKLVNVEDAALALTITDAGTTYTAAGACTITLPASGTLPEPNAAGRNKWAAFFRTTVAELMRVQTQGADVIRYSGVESSAAGLLEIAERDAVLDVEYVGGGVFLVTGAILEWSFGP